jgi:hypothetical protein
MQRWTILSVAAASLVLSMDALGQTVQNVGPGDVGLSVNIPETGVYDNGVQNQSNWEMYTGAFVDGTLAAVTNTEADGDFAGVTERGVAVWFTPDRTIQEVAGFLDDSGNPWKVNNDIARTDGNMPRIGPQVIAGQEANDIYMFGNECTPWANPEDFPSYGSGFAYDSQVASVQILRRGADGTPSKVTNVFDPTYGQATSGSQGGQQIRFGGSIRMLSNGNFVVIPEDRVGLFHPVPGTRCSAATIWDQTGTRVVDPFCAQVPKDPLANVGIWDNLAAYNGGFVIRNETYNGNNGLTFFKNVGAYVGFWTGTTRTIDPWDWPLPDGTTSIGNWSGSNERVSSHVALPYVHVVGRGAGSDAVYVTRVRANDQTTIGEAFVSEGYEAVVDRCESCTDNYGRVFVCWADSSNTGNKQIVGRFLDDNLDPRTDLFLVFENSEVGPTSLTGFSAKHPSCHMVQDPWSGGIRVLVTCRIDGPAESLGLATNDHYAIVISECGKCTGVDDWELY